MCWGNFKVEATKVFYQGLVGQLFSEHQMFSKGSNKNVYSVHKKNMDPQFLIIFNQLL